MNYITRDYVLLTLAKEIDLNSFIRVNNFMATIAGGIYELEQKKVVELTKIQPEGISKLFPGDFEIKVNAELPDELSYLKVLYDVIKESEKKTMHDVVRLMSFDVKTQYSNKYVAMLIDSLVKDNIIAKEEKKGFLGREKVEYKVNQTDVNEMTKNMLTSAKENTMTEHDVLLLYLLMKTDMLSDYYASDDRKFIKEKLEEVKQEDGAIKDVLQVIDNILVVLFGLLALFG